MVDDWMQKVKELIWKYSHPEITDLQKNKAVENLCSHITMYLKDQQESLKKHSWSEEQYEKVKKKYDVYSLIQYLHEHLMNCRDEVRSCLLSIVDKTRMDNDVVKKYIEIYRKIKKEEIILTPEDRIVILSPFAEESFLKRIPSLESREHCFVYNDKVRSCIFHETMAYCLFQFLSIEGNTSYLFKCSNCGDLILRKTRRQEKSGNYFCSDKCRLHVSNRRRIESGEHARYKREKGYYKY